MKFDKPPQKSLLITIVKLTSKEYSVEKGRLGYVSELIGDNACVVSWVGGSSSVPVLLDDLQEIGQLCVIWPEPKEQ